MASMFQDLTKGDSVFLIGTLCVVVFLWVLGVWKLIDIIF